METIFVFVLVALALEPILGIAVSFTHRKMSPPFSRSVRRNQISELLNGKSYFHEEEATWDTVVVNMHQYIESRKGGFLPWL
jgi:hypothetical protein